MGFLDANVMKVSQGNYASTTIARRNVKMDFVMQKISVDVIKISKENGVKKVKF